MALPTVLAQIGQLLPKLTSEELTKLSQQVSALRSLGGGSDGVGHLEHWLLTVIAKTLLHYGQPAGQVWLLQKNPKMLADLRRKGKLLEVYCAKATGERLEQTRLVRIALGLLYEDLRQLGVTVTAVVLVRHLHRLPAVLDRHFPGYANTGLLKFIVRKRGKPCLEKKSDRGCQQVG